MTKKTMKIIISFDTISDAMAMEKLCKIEDIKGKLIPIPREISAGCGVAWSSEIKEEENIMNIIKNNKIDIDNIYKMEY